ncbi:hypothetical protein [Glaesserella parasuis]|uniref:hypothetical protein n=1 Tax=Glaesserella parasuis TaxID=738 RepID=UPI000950025B|nr:hypothetical protein [Glaesserella parasuis]MWQ50400.1 hypothetical protein [Glaesserella parasuis]
MEKIYFYDYWYDKDDIDYDDLKREDCKQFTADIEKEDLSAMAEVISAIIIRKLRDNNNWVEFGEGEEFYIAFKAKDDAEITLFAVKEKLEPTYQAQEVEDKEDTM